MCTMKLRTLLIGIEKKTQTQIIFSFSTNVLQYSLISVQLLFQFLSKLEKTFLSNLLLMEYIKSIAEYFSSQTHIHIKTILDWACNHIRNFFFNWPQWISDRKLSDSRTSSNLNYKESILNVRCESYVLHLSPTYHSIKQIIFCKQFTVHTKNTQNFLCFHRTLFITIIKILIFLKEDHNIQKTSRTITNKIMLY